MAQIQYKDLLDAGVHFGHLTRKWDPRMAPYIFMEKNGIHIIDLNQSITSLAAAQAFVKSVVRSGRKIMFVATKKQAQEIVSEEAKRLKMPFVTERWLGGMLTNFSTIKKSLKKMGNIDKMLSDEATAANIAKREKLMLGREKAKLEKLLGGVADLSRLPAALFVVDVKREHLAIAEAKRLGIPVVAMCDTNSNPEIVDYAIPANDDAYKSVSLITLAIGKAIEEGILERKTDKESAALQEEEDAKRAVDTAREVVSRGDDEQGEGGKRKRVKTADAAEAPSAPEAEVVAEAPVAEVAEVVAEVVAEEAAPEAAAPSEEAEA
ncbi:30S ribosomal protein S2 [Lacihabitans sp. LS3-19]|uniref:30S ribosomal protein S2 n=1 Tax=Lacihabitans sp. LS3-19 TaxID=2487335 RepID=UPI0020CDF293|nr:30S ribosomal protein S2 [Lacihabitans sp. LS3-19]MCP9766736.1 30S ribosomal protein S2 [Lacihabitans sp. LS3-19]